MDFLKKILGVKEAPITSNADFWKWFEAKAKAFHRAVERHENVEENFFNKLAPKLGELREGFYYLTGMLDEKTAELILTPDGAIKNITFTEELVNAAPTIPGWKFTALKPPLDIKDVVIEMGEYKYGAETLWFYSNDNPNYPDEIDITIVHRDFNENDKSEIANGVAIFLDNYLGELTNVTTIDNVEVLGSGDAEKELVPIEKLKHFLTWREKEFVEKYEGIRHNTEGDVFSVFEASLKDSDLPIISSINTTLLDWDAKASHPWILTIVLRFKDGIGNGMPDEKTNQIMYELEEKLIEELKDSDGYLNIGHETLDNTRELYFACKEFRKPSKVADQVLQQYKDRFEVSYDIYKDKYWRSFNRFSPSL